MACARFELQIARVHPRPVISGLPDKSLHGLVEEFLNAVSSYHDPGYDGMMFDHFAWLADEVEHVWPRVPYSGCHAGGAAPAAPPG